MKKFFAILLALTMLFALAACGAKVSPAPADEGGEEDGQNPVMNFIGFYQCDRCTAFVEAEGSENAKFLFSWGSSAWEHSEWTMSGKLDLDTLTVEYADCRRADITCDDDGKLEKEDVIYENGTGRIVFQDGGEALTLTWEDDQEHQADGMVFTYFTFEESPWIDGLSNPWHDANEAEALLACPRLFQIPKGAESVEWRIMDAISDVPALVEATFTLDGLSYHARAQQDPPAGEDADLSGMYYTWTAEDDALENWNIPAKLYRTQDGDMTVDLCTWYDAEHGVAYSLSVIAEDLDGFDIRAIAEAMFRAE